MKEIISARVYVLAYTLVFAGLAWKYGFLRFISERLLAGGEGHTPVYFKKNWLFTSYTLAADYADVFSHASDAW